MKKILLLILVITVAGCQRYDIDEILISRNEISLTWKGTEQFVYSPETCQLGFNAAKNEFRAQTDNLSGWFVLTCKDMPAAEGDEIEADIRWTGPSETRSMQGLKFKVKKVAADGQMWLWCKSAKIGVTIRKL